MKIILKLLTVILLFTSSVFAEKETVKIGIILPLSGDMAGIGEDIQRGFLMAQKEAKQNNFKYELIFEDDAGSTAKDVLTANKLLHVNKADIIVCLWSNAANVIAPITEKEKIPMFGIIWDDSLAKKSHYVLTHETSATDYSIGTVKLIKDLGWRSVAFISQNSIGWQVGVNVLESELKKNNIELLLNEKANAATRDFRPLLQKVAQLKPDGVILYDVSPDSEIFLRQMNDLKLKIPVVGYFDDIKSKKNAEGVYSIGHSVASFEFNERFKKEYGHPVLLRAAHGYDIFSLIVKTYEESGSDKKMTSDQFIVNMKKVRNYPGEVGTLNVDQYGVINSPVLFRVIKNGEYVNYNFIKK